MTEQITGLLAAIVLISSVVAIFLVTRSKRVEKSLEILEKLVDTLTTGNSALQSELERQRLQHMRDREDDKALCDDAITKERGERQAEHLACQREIAGLQGRVDVLTTNIADVIATAVVAAVAVRTAVQGDGHS